MNRGKAEKISKTVESLPQEKTMRTDAQLDQLKKFVAKFVGWRLLSDACARSGDAFFLVEPAWVNGTPMFVATYRLKWWPEATNLTPALHGHGATPISAYMRVVQKLNELGDKSKEAAGAAELEVRSELREFTQLETEEQHRARALLKLSACVVPKDFLYLRVLPGTWVSEVKAWGLSDTDIQNLRAATLKEEQRLQEELLNAEKA